MPLQPAALGSARVNNFRLGYMPAALTTIRQTRVRILIAGVAATNRVRRASLSIHDVLNDAPNSCRLTVDGTAPSVDQDVRITINSDTPRLLFNGTLQTVDVSYELQSSQWVWPCIAADDLARLNRLRPFGTWTNVSATTIAQSIIATFAPAFSVANVEAGLPAISITFDGLESFSGCLRRIANLMGGYFYVEDLDVHLFLEEATDLPDPVDTNNPFLHDPPITLSRDTSQRRTRVNGKGHGESTVVDVAAGETILPIPDAVMFQTSGGTAIAGTTPDGAQWMKLFYAGVHLGGGGSLVGPGAAPSTQPSVTAVAGTGVESGVHQYAYTDVTGAGESLPSPLGSVTTGAIGPAPAPTLYASNPGGNLSAGTYIWAVSYLAGAVETAAGATLSVALPDAQNPILALPLGPPGTTTRKLYRTVADGSQLKLQGTVPDNTTVNWGDNTADGSLGANAPTANAVTLGGIAIGGSGTTSRKVYRTVAAGSQLKLQQTIANNTDTIGVTDATPDASLGANAPTSDTSGLTQPDGQVNAGSTSLLTASAGPFSTTGGWVLLGGGQGVRYTGVSGNTLTGIPATGAGAIMTTVLYGSQALPSPALVGVLGLWMPIQKGSAVHIWVERNDIAAQAALIALDAAQGRVSDGVVEHTITDARRGEASLIALCDADLTLFASPIGTVTYATRDVKTKSGKPVVVDLASPPISATLTIQDVTISEIDQYPGTAPRFTVTASSVRFSLEDLLRRMAVATGS